MAKNKNINQISFIFNEGITFEHDVSVSLKNLPQGYKKQFVLKLISEKFPDSKDLQSDIKNYMGLRKDLPNKNLKEKSMDSKPVPTKVEEVQYNFEIQEDQKQARIKNSTF